MRRLLAATAWIAGCAALFACYLRISFTGHVTSDGANNALQAWDMLHGNLLMHGWIIGDATYYTFDLPVLMLTEIFFGLQDLTSHVASALIYLVVTVCAVALAVADSRGLARLARAGVVVAVLTATFHVGSNAPYLLGAPDHTGTSVFLLVSVLLIDRAPARRYTSPLLLAILCAGQIGDATVGYVAVPAVVVVSVYRVTAARKVRTGDAANALAAVASVPLAAAVRALMLHFGAYQMVAPKTAIAPPGSVAAQRGSGLARDTRPVRRRSRLGLRESGARRRVHPRHRLSAGRGGRLRSGGVDLAYREPGRATPVRRDRHQPRGVRDFHHADS